MKIPKAPVFQKHPTPGQIAKANARRAADGLPPLGDEPRTKKAHDREALAEKVEAIMTAPRTVKRGRKAK